jgi:hypothetical protein
MAKNSEVVELGELPGELQDLANHWRASGRVVQARKDDAGEWRVAWLGLGDLPALPGERQTWVGWGKVVWPKAGYREWLR